MIIKKIISTFLILLFCFHLTAQGFNIEQFSNPKKYEWDDFQERNFYRQELKARRDMLQLYELKEKSLTENIAKTAIFPGWGHYSIESYNKGHVFLTSELILAGAGFYFITRSNDYYDKYKNATQINEINSNYDKASEHYTTASIFFVAYALVWLYSIYDIAESTENYNANLWDSLMHEHFNNVSIKPNGIEVRF